MLKDSIKPLNVFNPNSFYSRATEKNKHGLNIVYMYSRILYICIAEYCIYVQPNKFAIVIHKIKLEELRGHKAIPSQFKVIYTYIYIPGGGLQSFQ